jgi:hypothetical protein
MPPGHRNGRSRPGIKRPTAPQDGPLVAERADREDKRNLAKATTGACAPSSNGQGGRNRYEEKNRDEPFGVARNIPFDIHHDVLPFRELDGDVMLKVYRAVNALPSGAVPDPPDTISGGFSLV